MNGFNFIITDAFKKIFTGRSTSKKKRQRKKLDKRNQWRAEDYPIMFNRVNNTYILSRRQHAQLLRQQPKSNDHNHFTLWQ
jgi:hypothetical protein